MPKCVLCEKMFPPQFCVQMKTHPGDPNAKQCVWCEKGLKHIDLKGGQKYTKDECVKDYKIFLKKLAEKQNIAAQLIKGKMNIKGG